jgi:hypothetical protein
VSLGREAASVVTPTSMSARPIRPPFLRQVLPYLVAIIVIAAAATSLILWKFNPDREVVGTELIKSFVQVATVLVLGQALAIVVKDREQEREHDLREIEARRAKLAAVTALRAELLAKLSSAFVRVKGSRRLTRAQALTMPWSAEVHQGTQVRKAAYEEQMRAINGVELELESIWHQLDATDLTLAGELLVRHIKTMKDYLRELLFQYEHVLPQFTTDTLAITTFRDDPKYGTLLDFIDAAKNTGFKRRFVQPFRAASHAIRAALLAADEDGLTRIIHEDVGRVR